MDCSDFLSRKYKDPTTQPSPPKIRPVKAINRVLELICRATVVATALPHTTKTISPKEPNRKPINNFLLEKFCFQWLLSKIKNQKGVDAPATAASALLMYCSLQVTIPIPPTNANTPEMALRPHSCQPIALSPSAIVQMYKISPARIYLIPDNKNGGIPSRA